MQYISICAHLQSNHECSGVTRLEDSHCGWRKAGHGMVRLCHFFTPNPETYFILYGAEGYLSLNYCLKDQGLMRGYGCFTESDELSSGDWTEDRQDKLCEPPTSPGLTTTFLQAEVQRNYAELEKSISREIEANTRACQLVKSFTKFDEKAEVSDEIPRKPRESLPIPMPTLDDLSPEFKKKLDEWKKMKKTPVTPTLKDEPQGHFISKIGEWQRWRPGSSSHHKTDTHHYKHEHQHHLQEEFYKKLEEWQMLKSSKRSRSHSDRGKDDRDYQTPSPGLSRKNSKGTTKKVTSGKGSGSKSLSGSLKEKEGRAGRKSQKEKDLQWLEKELHKIEREKLRLEREREKYLEREAR